MHLMRTLNIEHNSNMAIIGMTILGFVIGLGLGVTGDDFGAALVDGLNLGFTVFLAWAVARELDPDRPNAAIVAGFLAAGLWLVLGRSSLAATVAALLAARILVRSTGRPPNDVDFLVCIGLAWYAGRTLAGWVAGLGLAYALARDVRLPGPARKHQRPVAFLVAAAATIGALMRSPVLDPAWSLPAILVVVAGIAAGLATPTGTPTSLPDRGDVPIAAARVVAARRLALVVAVFAAITGTLGVGHLSPVWAAILSIPIYDLFQSGSRRARSGDAPAEEPSSAGSASEGPKPAGPGQTADPARGVAPSETSQLSPPPPAPPPRASDPAGPPAPSPGDGSAPPDPA